MIPFIKWVGGKRQLLPMLKANMPTNYHKYYEPFIGGGALLFDIKPATAVINDINTELIHVYKTIQSFPTELILFIQQLDSQMCTEQLFFQNRARYNQKIKLEEYDIELAALFIWLNKHCFNGLYRVNKQGEFNVPYNKCGNIQTIDKNNLLEINEYLQCVTICNTDFENIFDNIQPNDFIFFDSPYDSSFTDYSKIGFLEKDHRRLANLFKELSDLGCFCMLTNHNTELIRELYKDYNIQEVDVRRSINSDGKNRQGKEIIVTNYQQKGVCNTC